MKKVNGSEIFTLDMVYILMHDPWFNKLIIQPNEHYMCMLCNTPWPSLMDLRATRWSQGGGGLETGCNRWGGYGQGRLTQGWGAKRTTVEGQNASGCQVLETYKSTQGWSGNELSATASRLEITPHTQACHFQGTPRELSYRRGHGGEYQECDSNRVTKYFVGTDKGN